MSAIDACVEDTSASASVWTDGREGCLCIGMRLLSADAVIILLWRLPTVSPHI